MSIESATYVNGLNDDYPEPEADRNTADNHLRLIKKVLLNTFPNLDDEVTAIPDDLNQLGDALTLLETYDNDLFPSGTKMVFYQAAAPTGWTAVTMTDGYMLRAISAGGTGGTTGGTHDPITMDKVPYHYHGLTSGSAAADGAHTHTIYGGTSVRSDGAAASNASGVDVMGGHADTTGAGYHTNFPGGMQAIGTSSTHTHTLSGTTDGNTSSSNWTPRYADVVIAYRTPT